MRTKLFSKSFKLSMLSLLKSIHKNPVAYRYRYRCRYFYYTLHYTQITYLFIPKKNFFFKNIFTLTILKIKLYLYRISKHYKTPVHPFFTIFNREADLTAALAQGNVDSIYTFTHTHTERERHTPYTYITYTHTPCTGQC